MIGQVVSHYRIVAELGRGGMGVVYEAEDTRLHRRVALKFLPEDAQSVKAEALQRFLREAEAASALNHPNICTIYDISEHDGRPFIVMEKLEGEPLNQILRGPAISRERLNRIVNDVARALAAAHAAGIVHRDVKPANIFVTSRGDSKLLDFGLARFDDPANRQNIAPDAATQVQASPITQPGVTLGTIGYMSPEQVQARVSGPASDVFSLGCVLYEMLSGRPPFQRATGVATLAAILHDEPEPLARANGDDDALERIAIRCLQKDPERRFHDGRELVAALSEKPAPLRPPASRSVAVAALILLLLAVAVALLVSRRANVPASPGEATGVDADRLVVMLPVAAGEPAPAPFVVTAVQEEIQRRLTDRPGLRLLPPASTTALAGTGEFESLLRKLGVDVVIRTTVRREQSSLHIDLTAQEPGKPSRSASVQARDLTAGSNAIMVELEGLLGLPGSSAAPASEVPEAMSLYYEARHQWSKRSADGVEKAIAHFQRALDLDPQFALAYVGLADAYSVLHNSSALPASETFPRARAAAMRAVEIDPSLPEAQISLAYISHYYDLDWGAAEDRYRRALALRPDHATAHQWYAELLSVTGRHQQARQEIERALELDPLSPVISATAIWIELMMRDYERGIARGRTAAAVNPRHPQTLAYLGRVLIEAGELAEGEATLRSATSIGENYIIDLWLAEALARAGKGDDALTLVEDVESRDGYKNPYYLAFPFVALGDHDRALKLLGAAVSARVEQRAWLRADPSLDPLRQTDEFQALVANLESQD